MVVFGIYQHFKTKNLYVVLGITRKQSSDEERMYRLGNARYSEDPSMEAEVFADSPGLWLDPKENSVFPRDVQYVVYQGLYTSDEFGPNPTWFRPANMFDEEIERDGKRMKRFQLVYSS